MLITPVLKKFKSSLDANDGLLFEFIGKGGDQVYKNELEIYNAETNLLVYQKIVTSFNFKHIVPLGTLTNGGRYKAKIRTYNTTGDMSNWSDFINFKCSTTPTIALNPVNNGIVNNQTYIFTGTYFQAEGEDIQSYKFFLYDRYQVQIAMSGEMYSTVVQHEFTGFDNDENYYIEIKAKSSGGVEVTTGLISIYAKYIQPRMNSVLDLTNNSDKATVSIEANIIQVIFESMNETYSYENNWINLATDTIHTDRTLGFNLNEPSWTLNMRFKLLDKTSNILTLTSMEGHKITVSREKDRLFIRYFYGDEVVITRFYDLSQVLNENVLNLYIQKNKFDLNTDLKVN